MIFIETLSAAVRCVRPIYEYECKKYGEKFELRRSINDADTGLKCPGRGKIGKEIAIALRHCRYSPGITPRLYRPLQP